MQLDFAGSAELFKFMLTVAGWLESVTDDRVVADSNPSGAASKLWQVRLPHVA